ncbi:MAG: hypothetical protein FWG89_00770 [Treponema sp.]|nr:hypothetical protein [Treponema sp.]
MGTSLFGGLLSLENESLSFGVITVCAICVLVLIANIIRRKIPLFRRSLMPTAVIAGLLGLVIKEIVLATAGFNIFSTVTLGAIVYHLLPIGFISLCLREKDNYTQTFDKNRIKIANVAAAKSGALIISGYLMQGIVGITLSLLISLVIMPELNPGTGIMLALGFGQGPQQANATGYIWDAARYMDAWGAGSARNFGLTISALGFLWSSIPGIILINLIAKKKGVTIKRNEFEKSGDVNSYSIESPDEIPLSESIDKFSLQLCMVGGVYLLTIGIVIGLEMIFRFSGITFLIDLVPTFWGFIFMLGALVALCTKAILRRLVKTGIMHRKYPNSYMMNRISGAAFDISITAALCLISLTTLGTLWIPVLVVTTAGGFATIFFVRKMCNHIYKDYEDEAFLAFYGNLTGTIANGMILAREIDKDFKTPASDDLVKGGAAGIVLGVPLLFLIAQAPRAGNLWWVTGAIVIYFLILMGYLLKDKLFKRNNA